MRRRTFIQTAIATPFFLSLSCTQKFSSTNYKPATEKSYEFLEVAGSYREIGRKIGKTFQVNIRKVLRDQPDLLNRLISIAETESGKKYSNALLGCLKKSFPHLVEELAGLADGAGLHFNIMWYLSIRSELFAFGMTNPGSCTVPPGCSTIYYKYKNKDINWLFHNEDGDIAYKNRMFVLKQHCPSGVSFYSLVYPGFITGVGPSINSKGIIETTNFIGCKMPEEGIPRYFIGRAILEAKDLKEAIDLASFEHRAFPWHHNLADISSGEYVSIETLPRNYKKADSTKGMTAIRKPANGEPFIHTNHTTADETADYVHQDIDYLESCSISRFKVLSELKEKADYPITNPKDLLGWLSSRKYAPKSPCKVGDENNRGQTVGTAFFDLKTGLYRLYKGAPCQAVPKDLYEDYYF